MHCRVFGNCARGSDPNRVWNASESKCAPEALLKRVFPKGPTEQPKHLNLNKTRENHCNTLKNFPLHGSIKNLYRFRCGGKGKHLNLASRHNSAANSLTTNELQGFRQLCPWFRSQQGWNTAACKCAPEVLLAGVSTKRATEQHMHLNLNKTRKIHCNILKNFTLRGFNKHLSWFRCGGKE